MLLDQSVEQTIIQYHATRQLWDKLTQIKLVNTFFQSKKEEKENEVTEMLQKMYNHEFTESQNKLNRENDGMSQEDLKFMQVLDNGTRLIDGHYEIPLPLHDDNVRFPNNRLQDEKRFTCLQKKCQGNINSIMIWSLWRKWCRKDMQQNQQK